MTQFKKALLASLIVAGSLAATPAFAATFQVYNGSSFVNSGTATITGPTTATVAGIPVPCTATFGLTLTSGVAKVTSASFSGSTACSGISAGGLPWPVTGAAISGSTSITVTITGISVSFTQPSAVCSNGTATGTLTSANPNSAIVNNNFTFTASFPPPTACTNVRSTGNLVSSKPIQFIP